MQKLAPGHYLVAEDGGAIRKYWSLLPWLAHARDSIAGGRGRLVEMMDETIRMDEISDVPVGFLLSGGVDSTAAVFCREETDNRDNVHDRVRRQEFEDERAYARLAAETYGTSTTR